MTIITVGIINIIVKRNINLLKLSKKCIYIFYIFFYISNYLGTTTF